MLTSLVAFFTELNWTAVFQIIVIDILLGGDNAVVIAMACRNLSPKARRGAIFWGVAGAIGLRVALIMCAMFLLEIAGLKIVAGALLLWIGIKLLIEDDSPKDVKSEDRLWQAVKTIIIADFVMSLDNVIGIAGAAQAAADHHQIILVIFGLLVSIPFIVFGSQIFLKLFTRFPVIVDLGGALLGWIGGTLLVGDTLLSGILPAGDATRYAAGIAGAVLVIAASKIILRARSRA